MSIEEITLEVLAERALSDCDSKILVNWSVKALELGYDSENLSILAGLDHENTEVREKYFIKSLIDLNIHLDKPKEDLIDMYAISIVSKAILGSVSIDFAFAQMKKIAFETNYSARYIAFYEIDEDLERLDYNDYPIFNINLTKENSNEFIMEEFKIFLEMERLNIPLEERDYNYCISCSKLVKPILKTKYRLRDPHRYQVWCCPDCKSEKLRFSSEHAVKWLIIESHKENEQNT